MTNQATRPPLKHPRIKCNDCGSNEHWLWDADDDYFTCDLDGNALYPPRWQPTDGRWSQER